MRFRQAYPRPPLLVPHGMRTPAVQAYSSSLRPGEGALRVLTISTDLHHIRRRRRPPGGGGTPSGCRRWGGDEPSPTGGVARAAHAWRADSSSMPGKPEVGVGERLCCISRARCRRRGRAQRGEICTRRAGASRVRTVKSRPGDRDAERDGGRAARAGRSRKLRAGPVVRAAPRAGGTLGPPGASSTPAAPDAERRRAGEATPRR